MDRPIIAGFVKEIYELSRQLERPGRPMLPWDELSPAMQEWWALFAQMVADRAEEHVLATVPLAPPAPQPQRKMLDLIKVERIIPYRPQQPVRRR